MKYGYSGTYPNSTEDTAAVFYGHRGLKSFRGNPAPAGVISPASAEISTDSSVTLSINAVNTLGYQWQKLREDVWEDILGGNLDALELYFPHEADQEGTHTYRCVCLGLAGIGYTEEVHIKVHLRAPTAQAKISKSTLTPAGTVKLSATYQYADSIKWQESTGTEWRDIPEATTGTHTLNFEYGDPAGMHLYRAVVSGIGGEATTDTLTLSVTYPEPSINVSASTNTVLPPASVTLTAEHNHADHGIKWQELIENEWEDIPEATQETHTVSFEYGTPRVYHYYRCLALGYGGSIASSTISISITYYPPECSITASEKETTIILSAASTYADIGLQWYEYNYVSEKWTPISGATENSYTVELEAGLTAGTHTYMCAAAGYGGVANSNTISINISYQAPTATISSSRTNIDSFPTSVLFGITATHAHKGVQWQKSADSITWEDVEGETAATMAYLYTETDKPKYIRCIAYGYGGSSASNIITMTGV